MKAVNEFAIDTLHSLTVRCEKNRWVITKEWYLDPLKEDTVIPDVMPVTVKSVIKQKKAAKNGELLGSYDREAAVNYAHKYCGVALTPTGKHYYNLKYRSYNGLGGDCTNFASQVLYAGGVRQGQGWYCYNGSGSKAWVHTDSLAYWLAYSGMAKQLPKGKFIDVVTPNEQFPYGEIQELLPGDLIGYEEKDDLVHFAVVIGRDSNGNPLVDTHTADRYKVPWDLGWDRSTVYHLYKIVY
jgi:hypothetical protein